VIAFPPHVMHVLQPVDVRWARSFKAVSVGLLRTWAIPLSQAILISRLHPTRELSEAMLQLGQIVAAPWESVMHRRHLVAREALIAAGLSDHVGRHARTSLAKAICPRERGGSRERRAAGIAMGLRVLTEDGCLRELVPRGHAKARWRR
jgi:hypothetical protein